MNVIFICTGNTCRSPMAEAILRSKTNGKTSVRSAGIHAQNGAPIAGHAKTLIEEAGMPYTPVSRAISTEDMDWADVILTMTNAHKQLVLYSFPQVKEKIHTLKGFLRPDADEDVHDPFGGDVATYRYTFAELSQTIEAIKRKLMEG